MNEIFFLIQGQGYRVVLDPGKILITPYVDHVVKQFKILSLKYKQAKNPHNFFFAFQLILDEKINHKMSVIHSRTIVNVIFFYNSVFGIMFYFTSKNMR